MQDVWNRIHAWLDANAPLVLANLQPGASEAQIEEAEKFFGIQFPDDVKASLRIHNGQSAVGCGFLDTDNFNSLDDMKRDWQIWKEIMDDNRDEGWQSDPEPDIANDWWNPAWIALTSDGSGNSQCLDLAPYEGGSIGQVTDMVHDDSERALIAPSYRAWLEEYASQLEAGAFYYSKTYDSLCPIEWIDDEEDESE